MSVTELAVGATIAWFGILLWILAPWFAHALANTSRGERRRRRLDLERRTGLTRARPVRLPPPTMILEHTAFDGESLEFPITSDWNIDDVAQLIAEVEAL